jgi:hypothetical protein
MELDLVLRAVMLPAAAVALACLAIRPALRRALGRRADAAMEGLLPVLASLVVFRALAVQQGERFLAGLAPGVAYGWLPAAVLLAAIVAATVGAGASRLAVRIACVAAPAAAFGLLAPPGFRGGEAQLVAAALTALAATLTVPAFRGLPRAGFAAWWLTLSAASALPIVAGFAKLGFVAAALAAAAAALGALSALRLCAACGPMMHVAMVTALGCIAFVGMAYDEAPLPRWCWISAALAPACSALAARLPASIPSRVRAAAIIVAPSVAIGAALAAAVALGAGRDRGDRGQDAYAAVGPTGSVGP